MVKFYEKKVFCLASKTTTKKYTCLFSEEKKYSIHIKQARKLQATLVRVRNYHPPTDLLTDRGEV